MCWGEPADLIHSRVDSFAANHVYIWMRALKSLQETDETSNHRYMKVRGPDPNDRLPENPEQRRSLTKVLVQSEHVENLVKESVEELSSVNTGIGQALVNQGSMPGVENVLEKSQALKAKFRTLPTSWQL